MSEEEVIEVDMAQLKKMKVPELRSKLAEWGLETKGNKAELLARVDAYLKEQEEELLEEIDDSIVEEAEGQGSDEVTTETTGKKEEKQINGTEQQTEIDKATPTVPDPAPIPVVKPSTEVLTDAERIKQRAERFGITSEEAKKISRAERFGMSLEKGYQGLGKRPPTAEDLEKMKKRGERFGITPPCMAKVEEEERKKKRMERFGVTVTDLPVDERKKARAERFGIK